MRKGDANKIFFSMSFAIIFLVFGILLLASALALSQNVSAGNYEFQNSSGGNLVEGRNYRSRKMPNSVKCCAKDTGDD